MLYDKISFFGRFSKVCRTISTFCYLVQIKKDHYLFYWIVVFVYMVSWISTPHLNRNSISCFPSTFMQSIKGLLYVSQQLVQWDSLRVFSFG